MTAPDSFLYRGLSGERWEGEERDDESDVIIVTTSKADSQASLFL